MAKTNLPALKVKILKSRHVQRKASAAIEARVLSAKQELLNEFDKHPVTQEIAAGPDLESSNILPQGYGNLYSFLGFRKGRSPVNEVREELEKIHFVKTPIVSPNKWIFRIKAPSNEDIENKSRMDWESGRSWIHAITYGLSGFSYYLFTLSRKLSSSRSGRGIQTDNQPRGGGEFFAGQSYLFSMLLRFKRKFTNR